MRLGVLLNIAFDASGRNSWRALAVIVLIANAASVLAVDDDVVVESTINSRVTSEVRHFAMEGFNQTLFPNGGKGVSEERMRTRCELHLFEVERTCQLSETQRQKLELAIRGDLQRFLGAVATVRVKYEGILKDRNNQVRPQFNEVYLDMRRDIQVLQLRMNAGLTDEADSLFMKVLPRILTADQQAKYNAVVAERKQFRYESNIAAALHNLEEVIFLSRSQREAVTKYLLTMPPPRQTGPYEMQVVICRIGTMPTEKLQPLFTDAEWRQLTILLNQYRLIRQRYIQSGVVDLEDVPDPADQEKP